MFIRSYKSAIFLGCTDAGSAHLPTVHVQAALDFMRTHHAERLSAKLIARQLRLSPCYICRILAMLTGKGIREHLRDIRMKEAAGLLKESRLEIKEIAWKVGYSHTSSFDRDFKLTYGVTPTLFRYSPPATIQPQTGRAAPRPAKRGSKRA